MDSCLNVEVSCTPDYYSPTKLAAINLLTWLRSTKYAHKVEEIRATTDKLIRDQMKALLPAIIIAGVFLSRTLEGIIKYSGLLSIDIDLKGNQHISNYSDLKTQISKIKNVAYVGLSVSGTGFFVIFTIAHPEKYKEHFLFIEQYFKGIGIIIDKACKDITRLRGYSHDPDAYFNHSAIPLTSYHVEPKKVIAPVRFFDSTRDSGKEGHTIKAIIEQVRASGTDLTSGYNNWYAIGCDIASTFGTNGEDYFQAISQNHPEYDFRKASKQYAACLKAMQAKPPSLGALVNAAKQHSINIKHTSRATPPANQPRILFRDGKRLEVLKDGSLIEVTPEGYPSAWDTTSNNVHQNQLKYGTNNM